jgi:hypothetical protein
MARENVENTIRPLGVLMDWPERGAGLGRDAREGNLLNQVFLADVIDWVGVATGVIGAVVAAPSGFRELYRQLAVLSPFRRGFGCGVWCC